jgi:hypothetical protein
MGRIKEYRLDTYCCCSNRNPITNSAGGVTFDVCSKKLGGCGKEIRDTYIEEILTEFEDHLNTTDSEGFTQEEIDRLFEPVDIPIRSRL